MGPCKAPFREPDTVRLRSSTCFLKLGERVTDWDRHYRDMLWFHRERPHQGESLNRRNWPIALSRAGSTMLPLPRPQVLESIGYYRRGPHPIGHEQKVKPWRQGCIKGSIHSTHDQAVNTCKSQRLETLVLCCVWTNTRLRRCVRHHVVVELRPCCYCAL